MSSTAPRRSGAISDVFDHPIVQRCQLHKLRNVIDRLPDAVASTVAKRMRRAYHHADALVAQAELETLVRELDRSHLGATASLREGLAETLTILRLGVPPTLARTLRSTNSVESMIAICRDHAANVKRWRDGQMVLRWVAAGMGEAARQFRRVNGYLYLPALRATISDVTPSQGGCRRLIGIGPPSKFHGGRDILLYGAARLPRLDGSVDAVEAGLDAVWGQRGRRDPRARC